MQDSLEPIFSEQRRKENDDNSIKVEKVLSKIVAYWPLFAVFIILAVALAYVYMRYATPKYMAYASMLIKDDAKGGTMGQGQLLQDLGMETGTAKVDNEVEILKSRSLMKKVVANLDLNIHYYAPGRIKTSEYYYKHIPFRLVPLYDKYAAGSYSYKLTRNGTDGFTIKDAKHSWEGHWGDTIDISAGKVVLEQNKLYNPACDFAAFSISIKPVEKQAIKTLRHLDVAPVNNKVSIIELSVSDVIPQRAEDIVNVLMDEYMQANIDDRNATTDGTIRFINERLGVVMQELGSIEREIETFKKDNKLTNLSEQSKALLDYTTEYAKQLTQQEVKLKIVESLEDYLADQGNRESIVPSTLLVEDNSAMSVMTAYNELQLKRSSLLLTNTENSPYIKNIDAQLDILRKDLMNTLLSTKQGIKVSIRELQAKVGSLDDKVRTIPSTERAFLEISRQQNIKQELYLYLLKKKEETAISKSSTIANARIVDPARADDVPYAPSSGKVYLGAIALALLIPGIWVFTKELFSIKIASNEDIRKCTSMNIIGEIVHNDGQAELVVEKQSKTVIAEQFRSLRTNLQFLLADKKDKSILLTSSMSGEGKSFIALNLASILAFSGEKVVLLELDLRKPKISANLGIESGPGFSKYVIGQAELSSIIRPSGIADSLFVIPSGTIPPNPAELMLSPKVNELFEQLEQDFDYIVIDSAPVGLVTDAQLLSRHANSVIYVCRMGYTYKQQLRDAEELQRTNKIKNMNLIVNDVKSKAGIYGYGYGMYGERGYFDGNDGRGGMIGRIKRTIKRK